MTDSARFVWKLSRRHTWGSPIPEKELIRLVSRDDDHDELRRTLEEDVLTLSFVTRGPNGIYIPNGQDAHLEAAEWLRENTELSDLKVKHTLSRLPEDWPDV